MEIIIHEKGGECMAYTPKYGKPNMTNLPSDLGIGIFEQILNTPKPDYKKMQEESMRLEREMVKVREAEDAKRTWNSNI